MATFDLEEQEQLDAIKNAWERWGNLVTWILIIVLAAYAAWNGWNYWQRRQGALASTLYGEVQSAVDAGDVARIERTLADMQKHYGSTTYAGYAALLAAKALDDGWGASRPVTREGPCSSPPWSARPSAP